MTDLRAASAEGRALIEKLIAFDTTSRNSNLELIHFVQNYLDGFGIASTLTHDETGQKANLYATLGPDDRSGIALSGHTDVVPIDGQDWSNDPWHVLEHDGKLYGRGTCDMKSFIALVLAYVPVFLDRGLQTPIHLCFSFDEEIGCVGVRHLLEHLAKQEIKPAACIIGEPTSMKVINAHKGKLSLRCHVRGHECHSSLAPEGVNAVEAAARVIAKLSDMAARKQAEGPFDNDFDVAYTTVHCGVVQGGTALNIVPKDCFFEFEFRNLPSEDSEELLREVKDYAHDDLEPAMQRIAPDTGFFWESLSSFPGLETPEDAEVVQLAKSLAGANTTGKVAFGTEGGRFQEAGIPAVICGPGSIEQAHKPDEYVSLEQLALCERFLTRLADRVSRG